MFVVNDHRKASSRTRCLYAEADACLPSPANKRGATIIKLVILGLLNRACREGLPGSAYEGALSKNLTQLMTQSLGVVRSLAQTDVCKSGCGIALRAAQGHLTRASPPTSAPAPRAQPAGKTIVTSRFCDQRIANVHVRGRTRFLDCAFILCLAPWLSVAARLSVRRAT